MSLSARPFWFTPAPFVYCRGTPSVDGFFAVPRQRFGCPPLVDASRTVLVCPFPGRRSSEDHDSPVSLFLQVLQRCPCVAQQPTRASGLRSTDKPDKPRPLPLPPATYVNQGTSNATEGGGEWLSPEVDLAGPRPRFSELLKHALTPGDRERVVQYFEAGRTDAALWIAAQRRAGRTRRR
jgi:hypothetical protein